MSCEEALKDNTLSARHAVEEAMTEAMIRKCKYVYWLRGALYADILASVSVRAHSSKILAAIKWFVQSQAAAPCNGI